MISNSKEFGFGTTVKAPWSRNLDMARLLRRRLWIIAAGLALGCTVGYLLVANLTPVYESNAQVLVVRNQAAVPVQVTRGRAGNDDGVSDNLLDTHALLIASDLIIGRAIAEHDLKSLTSLAGTQESLSSGLAEHLTISRGAETASDADVLTMRYRCSVAEDCPTVLRAIIGSYQEFIGTTFDDASAEAVKLITQAKEELSEELARKEEAYRAFRREAPLLSLDRRGTGDHHEQLDRLEAARTDARLRTSEASARLQSIEDALKNPDNRIAAMLMMENVLGRAETRDASPARAMDQQLLALQLQEQELRKDFDEDHPALRQLQEEVALAKEFFQKQASSVNAADRARLESSDLLAAYVSSLHYEQAEFEAREKELTQLVDEEQAAAKQLVNYGLQDETLRADIDRTQRLFDAVVARLQEINLLKEYGAIQTQVITPAEVGEQVWPVFPLVISVCGLLGLFGGFGVATGIELRDKSFRNPDEIRNILGVPVVGHLPILSKRVSVSGKTATKPQSILCTVHHETSWESEVIRGVRATLFAIARAQDTRVIQITSPSPKDGKTALAANLAVSIAKSGHSVVLVDADLRRPSVHEVFGIDGASGTSDVISGDLELVDALRPSGVPNLSLLPGGSILDHPAELVSLPKLKEMIDALRERYTYVLLDTPALLSVSDPSSIASCVDGVLLVMQVTNDDIPRTLRAKETLDGVGANLLGVVVNRLSWSMRNRYPYRFSTQGLRRPR